MLKNAIMIQYFTTLYSKFNINVNNKYEINIKYKKEESKDSPFLRLERILTIII